MVNVVSLATCWQRVPCETFLKGARREVIELPSCADCPITFEPYYSPFDVSTFRFWLVKIEDLDETVTEITEYRYGATDGVFRIDAGLPSCRCGCNPCQKCPTEYKLVVEYEAGYEELPDCVLPVFCNLLEVIKAKRNCDCEECGCENPEQQITYAKGDVVSVALETAIGKELVEAYKSQLGMISLCRGPQYLWGMIV